MSAIHQQCPRGAWEVAADLLRLLALASVPVAAFSQPVEGAIRFAGIFAVLLVSRSRVPQQLDAAWAATLLVSAWASALQWYTTYASVDIPIHFATTGATAGVLFFLLRRTSLLSRDPGGSVPGGTGPTILTITLIGGTLSAVWEMYEWTAAQFVPNEMVVGYSDTVGDQAMGVLGSATAAIIIAHRLRHHPVTGHRVSTSTNGASIATPR